jgi:organic hydroperoxide reductase OsmC/OhrA
MQPLPHFYKVASEAKADSPVKLQSEGVVELLSTAPREFGGSGEEWSPEGLLVASVADCFIMTFKALARASKLDWEDIACDAVGKLDRIDKVTQFVQYDLMVSLNLPGGANRALAERLLQKSKDVCLITNSLKGECLLETEVIGGE